MQNEPQKRKASDHWTLDEEAYDEKENPENNKRQDTTGHHRAAKRAKTGQEAMEKASKAKSAGFGVELVGLTGNWEFKESIGQTGTSHAGLWVQYDRSLRVSDRMLVKETYMEKEIWDHPSYWTQGRPNEFTIPRKLQLLEHADNIVRHKTFSRDDEEQIYRVYMEYCPHGSLEDLIRRQAAAFASYQSVRPHNEPSLAPECHIPVRAMWAIFEALASCLCLLKSGHLPGNTKLPNWEPYIHSDIKPDNIFLARSSTEAWPGIPVVKLGDYGLAHAFSLHQERDFLGHGTKAYMAPEQHDCPENEFKTFGPSAEVFSVGRVMQSLMNLRAYTRDDSIPACYPNSDPKILHFEKHAEDFYPQKLKDLVRRCLRIKVPLRIDAADLWTEIHNEVTFCRGLRGPMKTQRPDEGEVLLFKEDLHLKWAPQA